MMHIKKFEELFEAQAVHRSVKPEKLPHCSEMQKRGYRIAMIGGQHYAFDKNYEPDDEIYWLGEDTIDYKFGQRYIATVDVTRDRANNPFYSLYCKCDPSPTDEEKKKIEERDKDLEKVRQQRVKEVEKIIKEKNKKKLKI
jgi:hypothetical protein